MELCEKSEVFVDRDDDCFFECTHVILRDPDGEYFYSKTHHRLNEFSELDINSLATTRIPAHHIWPLASPKLTRVSDPPPADSYLKRPHLLYYEEKAGSFDYHRLILAEIEVCEILRIHPHPNIAKYLGCVVKDGRVQGLSFTRYPTSLSDMLKDGQPFDTVQCMRGIEAGVSHLHALGLIHNDLNPSNIMMDGDRPVIIDFDSCTREGEKLGQKGGTFGWSLEDGDFGEKENDLYSLSKIRTALLAVEGPCN